MARKRDRARGEGTIVWYRGRYRGAVWVTLANGERKRVWRYGRTPEEVARKLLDVRRLSLDGQLPAPDRMTVADLLERWLSDVMPDRVRPVTLESYRRYATGHIIPRLGAVKVQALRPLHVQQAFRALKQDGAGPRTIQLVHTILRAALRQAVLWEIITRNPADAVSSPRPASREMQTLSAEQVLQFLASAREDRLFPLYLLAAASGMRRGELLALRWQDIDWTRGAVQVRRTLEWVNGGPVFVEPKTLRGRRSVPLPRSVATLLRQHRASQNQERLAAGPLWQRNDLVFSRADGSPIPPHSVSHQFAHDLKQAGLPAIRFHDLRHTHATLLLEEGLHAKVVSAQLGHSSIVSMDVYAHVTPGLNARVAEHLDRILGGAVQPNDN